MVVPCPAFAGRTHLSQIVIGVVGKGGEVGPAAHVAQLGLVERLHVAVEVRDDGFFLVPEIDMAVVSTGRGA